MGCWSRLRGSIGSIPALFGVPLSGSGIAYAASPGPGGDRLHIWVDSRVGIGQKVLGSSALGGFHQRLLSFHLLCRYFFDLQHLHDVVIGYVGDFFSKVAFNQLCDFGAHAAFFGFAIPHLAFLREAAVFAFPEAH